MRERSVTPLVFDRIGQTRVYAERDPVPAGLGFGAYVVAADNGALPASLQPDDAWTTPALSGWFLFLPQPVDAADRSRFALAVEQSSAFPTPAHTSFAWLAFVDGVLTPPSLVPIGVAGTPVVAADAALTIGRYGIVLRAGTTVLIELDAAERATFVFQYPTLAGAAPPNTFGVSLAMDGDARFCLEGEGAIADFTDGETGWDVALRFFAGDVSAPTVLRYPVFAPFGPGEHAIVQMRWDPLTIFWQPDPAQPARSFVRFTGAALRLVETPGAQPEWSLAPASLRLRTTYRSVFGDPIELRPIPGDGGLALQPIGSGASRQWYAVPSGRFELRLAGDPRTPQRFLCGLAGTEFIGYTADADIVTFHPTQAAYAAGFAASPTARRSARARLVGSASLLDATFVTAWISVARRPDGAGDDPIYFAQPDASPLYSPEATAPARVLPLFDAPAAILTPAASAFPVAPYGGLAAGDTRPLFTRFEQEVLNPVRKAQTASSATTAVARPAAGTPTITTTPQGFLAEVDGTTWNWVQLAANTRSDGTVQALRFDGVSGALREALQSNELFLVITDPAQIAGFRHVISIEDWPFDIDVGAGNNPPAGVFKNVLVFKFGAGSVLDRVRDLATWSAPAAFNQDPEAVQGWLDAYIESARQDERNSPRLAPFVDRMTRDSWQGVIALAVDVGLDQFPADLKGLLGGIDLSQFLAHHMGIEVSRVEPAGGTLSMPGTSLFALINYVDKDLPGSGALARTTAADPIAAPGDDGYDFRVLTLLVVFENSLVVDFASRIVVTITKLFGEDARRQDDSAIPILENTVELKGRYERHGDVAYYVFVGDAPVRFLMDASHIFYYVEILKAQFHTLQPKSSDTTTIDSRFSFWGTFSFRMVEGIDVLSFGHDPKDGAGTSSLFFSSLAIDMRFTLPGGDGDSGTRVFTFNTSLVSFDLGQSKARAGSLFDGLPLALSSIDAGDGKRTPAAAGYLPVLTQFENASGLDARWFGIAYGLNLGTLGALAEQAGFTARILTAWSPGGEAPRVALLIQLPGTGVGKKELSIQNVLKLAIGQIRLSQYDRDDGKAFQLVLSNVGLSFLGISLPSSAYMELALFGDPAGMQDGGNLGWYGVWQKTSA
jgi:hypothetical protein